MVSTSFMNNTRITSKKQALHPQLVPYNLAYNYYTNKHLNKHKEIMNSERFLKHIYSWVAKQEKYETNSKNTHTDWESTYKWIYHHQNRKDNKNPMLEQLIKDLYTEHIHPFMQMIAMNLAACLTYVSFQEFTKTLEKTIQKLKLQLDNRPYVLVFQTKDNKPKSSCWIGSKLIEDLGYYPSDYIWIDYFHDTPSGIKQKPNGATYVRDYIYVDDATYSGSQLVDNISTIIKGMHNIPSSKHVPNIHIVVPYYTDHALKHVNSIFNKRCKINFVTTEKMPSASAILVNLMTRIEKKWIKYIEGQIKKTLPKIRITSRIRAILGKNQTNVAAKNAMTEAFNNIKNRGLKIITSLRSTFESEFGSLYLFEHKVPDGLSLPNIFLLAPNLHPLQERTLPAFGKGLNSTRTPYVNAYTNRDLRNVTQKFLGGS